MDIVLFFGLLFFAFFLAFLYYSKTIVYFGVLSAMILLFLGINLAATGYIEKNYTFMNVNNETVDGNTTEYTYSDVSHTQRLSLSREFINVVGILLMVIGGFMVADFGFNVNEMRRRD